MKLESFVILIVTVVRGFLYLSSAYLYRQCNTWLDTQSEGGTNGFRSPYYQRDNGFWLRMQHMIYE
jgi:hypothetical protein